VRERRIHLSSDKTKKLFKVRDEPTFAAWRTIVEPIPLGELGRRSVSVCPSAATPAAKTLATTDLGQW